MSKANDFSGTMKGAMIAAFISACLVAAAYSTIEALKPIEKGDQVQFYTDPGTACEYLISPNGTLVPRIDHTYMQGGCDPQEDY